MFPKIGYESPRQMSNLGQLAEHTGCDTRNLTLLLPLDIAVQLETTGFVSEL